eukprot:1810638-Prymnesium_polylepis.1
MTAPLNRVPRASSLAPSLASPTHTCAHPECALWIRCGGVESPPEHRWWMHGLAHQAASRRGASGRQIVLCSPRGLLVSHEPSGPS